MKKYVFLVKGIEDLSGAPRYVNNKCHWLQERGWEVYVFWGYDVKNVQLEYVIPFDNKDFIYHELLFFPCWFSNRKRNLVIKKIANRVGNANQIVVESNKLQLGAWGEMLAERLHAKHINFVTTEKIRIHNQDTFDFCYAKLKRDEFFTINASSVQYLFSKFVKIEQPEKYYWSATPNVEVEEYNFPAFDNLPEANYTICHFGRTKGYFSYMIKQLKDFVVQHIDKTFNVFFLGDVTDVSNIRNALKSPNVHIAFHPAVLVVPRQVITKSDVVVATAGCANLAYRNGGKVISMDVNNKTPLGLVGYTTLDLNTNSGHYENNRSLLEWFQVLLIDKISFEQLENSGVSHSFEYQMQFLSKSDGCYYDITNVNEIITKHDKLWMVLCRLGLFWLVDLLYFSKRK